ncbi:macro domain-containing protein [Pseudomonas inefficax]|uniref:macro domain-containing protein n=1 Tax=Pseudomonas inefficax TaxID=2078786 RepID=UPI003266112C
MIEFVGGDFFEFDADIRVNTVNCVGVMGAGVALAFKNKYPEMFREYVLECKEGGYKPGHPKVWRRPDMFEKELEVVNFPTKGHWRFPSEYEYIETGLVWLADYLQSRPGKRVTLPALGCGHGGLDWRVVKKMIHNHLHDSPAIILVFEPQSSKKAALTVRGNEKASLHVAASNVLTLGSESDRYPRNLRCFTDKDLYVFGDVEWPLEFDVSIISSTKPDEEERYVLAAILKRCKEKKLSVLFGASLSDKKLAAKYSATGLRSGVFLPSGIMYSAENLKTSKIKNLTLLSIGSPTSVFNKKDYLPAVISRFFLGEVTIFTTKNLEWISKQKRQMGSRPGQTFFINYPSLSGTDAQAAVDLNIKPSNLEISGIF